jgi:hypothetical protein
MLEVAPVDSLVSLSWKYEVSFIWELGDSARDEAFDDPPNTRRKNPGRSLLVLILAVAEALGFAVIVVDVFATVASG